MASIKSDQMFEYCFSTGSNRPPQTLKVPINIEELKIKDVDELCARLVNFHCMPCFVETGIITAMKQFVDEELANMKNENSSSCVAMIRNNPDLIREIADNVAKKYQKTCVKYAEPISDKVNEFPLAYHYLIHSAAMESILKLELKYHAALSKVIVNKEQSILKMQERHQLEMARICEHVGFAYSNEDVTVLASKQLADAERLLSHWENEYSSMILRQKQEFSEVLINLYKEMKQNGDRMVDSAPAYNKIKQIIDENVTVVTPLQQNGSSVSESDSLSQISSPNISSLNGSSGVLMEESFTINLGAQLKTMHNVRLVVTDILNFCRFSDEGEMEAQRFHTAMSLYSNSLSALILLADERLAYQTGIQKEFSSICHSSTEFHFNSLSEQLVEIEKHASICRKNDNQENGSQQEEGFLHLTEGDFFITKHSNLSQVHVVFHIVADENSLQTKASLTNVTSRHPVITSLRQILKVSCSYDIGTITIPLLLTHELTEEITFQWCVKRAELVMKCVKGFMMEMATWDGGVSRTVQFVIPPGISEEVFDRMRSTLPEVFRTTSTRNLTRSKPSR